MSLGSRRLCRLDELLRVSAHRRPLTISAIFFTFDRFKAHRAITPTREYPYAGALIQGNVHHWHSG